MSSNASANCSAGGYIQYRPWLDLPWSLVILLNLRVKGDDPWGRAVYGAGLPSLDYWDRWFESLRGHVSCVCCVVSGLCEELIARS